MGHAAVFVLVSAPLANALKRLVSCGPLVVLEPSLETHGFGDG